MKPHVMRWFLLCNGVICQFLIGVGCYDYSDFKIHHPQILGCAT